MVAPEEDDLVRRREYEGRQTDILVRLTALEGDIKNLRSTVDNNERRREDKEQTQTNALDRANAVLNEKLEGMNQFRRQLDNERALYVTRDQLDLTVKAVNANIDSVKQQLQPLRESRDYGKGRDTTVYNFIAIGVAVVAAVIGILAIVFH